MLCSNPFQNDCCCWSFPVSNVKQRMELRNAKYCWLHPASELHAIFINEKLYPPKKPEKSVYTKCDHQLETCVQQQIIDLEADFKVHELLVDREMHKQVGLINRMYIDSTRYLLLTEGGVCVKLYPEIVSVSAEARALKSFKVNLRCLRRSNYCMQKSVENINISRKELTRRCDLLDMSLECPFIEGDWHQRALPYVREVLDDLFEYFSGLMKKLKMWSQLLHIRDLPGIEDYKALITQNDDYKDNLMSDFTYCKCHRIKYENYLNPKKQCANFKESTTEQTEDDELSFESV